MTPGLLSCLLLAAAPASFEALPAFGPSAEAFVPAGWTVESRHEGDLTRDGVADLVLVLVQREGHDPGHRALLVLARAHGRLEPLGHSTALLQCVDCAGVTGGSGAPTIEFAKGVLVVRQRGGSRESWSSVHRFRLDPKTRRMLLIGRDHGDHDRATGQSFASSVNLLTGEGVNETWTQGQPPQRETFRVPSRTLALEEVTVD